MQKLCLPYLRVAALLKYHLYQQPLPDIRTAESEFVRLVYYLELVTESMDWECFNAAVALNWPSDTEMYAASPTSWCNQFAVFVSKSQIAARAFLVDQHITWHPPRLLQLPREYEKIFTVSQNFMENLLYNKMFFLWFSITMKGRVVSANRCRKKPVFVYFAVP